MKKIYYFFLVGVLFFMGCKVDNSISNNPWKSIASQLEKLELNADNAVRVQSNGKKLVSPRSLGDSGELKMVPSSDWCSGFFPGCLWLMYEQSREERWKESAQKYTGQLADQQFNGRTHDMGFKMYCSYGNGYRLTHNPEYRNILIQSAKTLISRFNPKVGCLRSWDHHQDQWKFPVIIDNMMNLELLFWATRETGDSTYYKIAVSHAQTTIKNHFRTDYSSWHVVDYNPETGEVVQKQTHQGYADGSSWARGQAWALYGFTMAYRETKQIEFLQQADNIAHFILNNKNMPGDLVPYWDFDAPNIPDEPRDASAAAVIASALLELSGYSSGQSATYMGKAKQILKSLTDSYRSSAGNNNGFLLDHSTGSKPHDSEVDIPLIYADYYYMESLIRLANYFD